MMAVFVLVLGVVRMVFSGDMNPPAAPAPTMKNLDRIGTWSVRIDNAADCFLLLSEFNNEAVLDRETGLVWARYAGGSVSYSMALMGCSAVPFGGRWGWHVPTRTEFESLIPLTSGHPFLADDTGYWTTTPRLQGEGLI